MFAAAKIYTSGGSARKVRGICGTVPFFFFFEGSALPSKMSLLRFFAFVCFSCSSEFSVRPLSRHVSVITRNDNLQVCAWEGT